MPTPATNPTSCWPGSRTLLALLLLVGLTGGALAQTGEAGYRFARWRASAWIYDFEGYACWALDGSGALRLEVLSEKGRAASPLQSIFRQAGIGWSVVLGEPGEGTFNPWREAWSKPSPGWEEWIRQILVPGGTGTDNSRMATGNPLPRRRFRGSRGGDPPTARIRWVLPVIDLRANSAESRTRADRGFRQRWTWRGRGRGDDREVALLTVWNPGQEGGAWPAGSRGHLASSRRPGSLDFEILRFEKRAVPPEIFLPLWPLRDVVPEDEIFPGTR